MKKQFLCNALNLRKTILCFCLSCFLLFNFVPSTMAQGKLPTTIPVVSITYTGSVNDHSVFRIEFENKKEESLTVIIKDSDGNNLYRETVKDKKFSKRFGFEKELLENTSLTVTLMNEKEKQSQSFEVNTSVRMVQDVVITKL